MQVPREESPEPTQPTDAERLKITSSCKHRFHTFESDYLHGGAKQEFWWSLKMCIDCRIVRMKIKEVSEDGTKRWYTVIDPLSESGNCQETETSL